MPREQCALFSGTATLRYMRKALFERIKADNERSSKPGAGAALAQAIGTRPAASRAPTPPAGPVSPLGKEGTRPRAGRGSADDSGVQGQGPASKPRYRFARLTAVALQTSGLSKVDTVSASLIWGKPHTPIRYLRSLQ